MRLKDGVSEGLDDSTFCFDEFPAAAPLIFSEAPLCLTTTNGADERNEERERENNVTERIVRRPTNSKAIGPQARRHGLAQLGFFGCFQKFFGVTPATTVTQKIKGGMKKPLYFSPMSNESNSTTSTLHN